MKAIHLSALTLVLALGFSQRSYGSNSFGLAANDSILKALEETRSGNQSPKEVLESLKGLANKSTRLVGATQGDLVAAYIFFYPPNKETKLDVSFDESERTTLLAQQFKTLITIAEQIGGAAARDKEKLIKVERFFYRLKYVRADLSVNASFSDKSTASDEDTTDGTPKWVLIIDLTDTGTAEENASTTKTSFSTGPREQWSISANVPLNRVSQLKINDQTNTVESKEQPGLFYIGLDYNPFGDVLGPASNILDAFTVKLLLKASKKPLDSYGVALGLRPGFFARSSLLSILDTISPFVAYTTTREDKKLSNGTLKPNAGHTNEFRIGLSFSLDKAVDWTKGSKDSDKKGSSSSKGVDNGSTQ